MRLGKKWNLSTQYIGPYFIAKRIDNITSELDIPQELEAFIWFSRLYVEEVYGWSFIDCDNWEWDFG